MEAQDTSLSCICVPHWRDGYEYIPWLSARMQICVYTPVDVIAVALGFINIGFWVVSQVPQLWENYKRKNVAGLSGAFLFGWLIADTAALIGCMLTGQEAWLIATAGYYVLSDLVLGGQFLYYSLRAARKADDAKAQPLLAGASPPPPRRRWLRALSGAAVAAALIICAVTLLHSLLHSEGGAGPSGNLAESSDAQADAMPPLCDAKPPVRGLAGALGAALSWGANIIYVAARVPQLVKNFQRKSVEGLSMLMFFCSIGGNSSFALAILLRAQGGLLAFWVDTFPYLLSCLVTIACDLGILLQSHLYRVH